MRTLNLLRIKSVIFAIIIVAVTANSSKAAYVPIAIGNSIAATAQVKSYWKIKSHGIVMQKMDYSCGSAALATILRYSLNYKVSEKQIIDHILKTGDLKEIIKRKGFSLLDLKHFVEYSGFTAQGYRMDLKDILNVNVPVLVPIVINGYRHFVVYIGHKNGNVFLLDPAFGVTTLSIYQFKNAWYAYQHVGLIVTKNGYTGLAGRPLKIKKEWEIFISSRALPNIIYTTVPFMAHDPLQW